MDTSDVVSWINDDAAEMTALLRDAAPDRPVPACPGWNATDLSRHVAGAFAGWYCYNISTPLDEWNRDELRAGMQAAGDDHHANVDLFETAAARFTAFCAHVDLDAPSWSFGGTEPARWWVRRAASELTVHLTDAAGMHGRRASTSAERQSEAIDEVMTELFRRMPDVRATMNAARGTDSPTPVPPDRPAAFVATDTGRAWTLRRSSDDTTHADRGVEGEPAAIGRGSSSDLLAWLHGRPMSAPLQISGEAALLDEWNLLQLTDF